MLYTASLWSLLYPTQRQLLIALLLLDAQLVARVVLAVLAMLAVEVHVGLVSVTTFLAEQTTRLHCRVQFVAELVARHMVYN